VREEFLEGLHATEIWILRNSREWGLWSTSFESWSHAEKKLTTLLILCFSASIAWFFCSFDLFPVHFLWLDGCLITRLRVLPADRSQGQSFSLNLLIIRRLEISWNWACWCSARSKHALSFRK
jgi:hypothetical protein